MNDVARTAGVSITTVSHVINNTRKVDPVTREKVELAMQDLGYRPNSLARALRSGDTNTIGMIVPDVSNQFFADFSRNIENYGFEENYSVILCNSDNDMKKQSSYVDTLISKQVDGVIFISAGESSEDLKKLYHYRIPIVVVDRDVELEYADVVLLDNEAAGYEATQYLIQLGHQKIACISGPNDLTPSNARVHGYQKALAENNINFDPAYLVSGDFRFQSGEQAMNQLLSLPHLPSAVFVLNDMMAIGAFTAIRKAGLNVPKDISIIGFDNILMTTAVTPMLTTVGQPIDEIAKISINHLIQKIKTKEQIAKNQKIVLKAQLIIRESTQEWSKSND
jgi:LacI family transcriptional regulator